MNKDYFHSNSTFDVADVDAVEINVRPLSNDNRHYISLQTSKWQNGEEGSLGVYVRQDIHLTTAQLRQLRAQITNYLAYNNLLLEHKPINRVKAPLTDEQLRLFADAMREDEALAQFDAMRDEGVEDDFEGISLA